MAEKSSQGKQPQVYDFENNKWSEIYDKAADKVNTMIAHQAVKSFEDSEARKGRGQNKKKKRHAGGGGGGGDALKRFKLGN